MPSRAIKIGRDEIMQRFLAFLLLISCVSVGNAVAKDILIVPLPSGASNHHSNETTAAVVSNLLSDIASDMALKAARDHGPEAVRAFQKHGPVVLKSMRKWTEAALNSGGRYAVQTISRSTKIVPQFLTGSKNIGLSALASSKSFVQESFFKLLKNSESAGAPTVVKRRTHTKVGNRKIIKKTTGT